MFKLINKFRCRFGLHKWVYTPPIYSDVLSKKLKIPQIEGFRVCSICKNKQILQEVLVGLNPEDHYIKWISEDKVIKVVK